jgi:glycosyltransferase involved in cell wall biosynthesis
MRVPIVSVIIPTHNRAWVLAEAVDSVLAQTFPDYELIVVDDGSTDATADLLAGYGARLRVEVQAHQGVSAARNRGIARANGELLAFLDSDDLWLPHKLRRQVDFMASRPAALICQTGEVWIRRGVRVNPARRHRKPSGMIFDASLALCLVSPSAVMARRALFEEAGTFDESLPACEDYDLWLRVSARFPVYLLDQALVVKRGGHPDQLSSAWGLDRYRIRALAKILEGGVLTASQQRAAVATLERKCRIYAAGCRKRRREAEARAYDELATRFHPADA